MKKLLILSLVLGLFVSLGMAQSITQTPVTCDDGKLTLPVQGQNPAQSRGSITTHFSGGNGFCGNSFDVTFNADASITDMDVHWSIAGELLNVEVYYRTGTAYGFETNPSGWTLMDTVTGVTAAGLGLPTNLGGLTGSPTFLAGQTYGIIFYVSNYDVLGGSIQYTNGQNTYSNTEVTLLTHAGVAFPIFTSIFYPREWNGTLYYSSGPVPASVDVKVNGEDAGVVINETDNVVIDISVNAGADAGLNSDIWVLVKSDAGKKWSYSKAAGRWYKGWCTEYVSEPLDDHGETVLDMILPIGFYDAYIGIDTDMNGMLNIAALLTYDMCDFEVKEYFPPLYDNGATDGTNGYFYSADYSAGLTVSILDDFVIPGGETWTIDGFNDTAVAAGNLTGFFVDFLADAAGAPGASVATATGVVASEAVTGLTWFGFPEYAHTVTFDPVVLGAGTYWVEVAPYTGGSYQYGMIKSTVTGTELWWRDTGVFGGYFGPGTGQFGVPADLGFQLQGTK